MLFKNQKKIIENGQTKELKKARKDILDILASSLNAVDPYKTVKSKFHGKSLVFEGETIDISEFKNIFLVGFGKASIGMTEAVCDSVDIKRGAVVTSDPNKKVRSDRVATFVGGHPLPNQKSIDGTEMILEVVKKCREGDLLIVLISGGGSSLFCKPRVKLRDWQQTTDLLLKSGANIHEINTIRKHLSFVKGGQLVKSVKCKVISLIISDVVGNHLEDIASGPTCPDSTTYIDARKTLKKYNLLEKVPSAINKVLDEGFQGKIPETLKGDDPIFDNVFNFIVANNDMACKAAVNKAEKLGYDTMLLTTSLIGEAKEIGRYLVGKARNYYSRDIEKIVFVSGGETTVTIRGNGMGGRNQEMVLGGVEELDGADVVFASFATDGIDGVSSAAGAIADGFTMVRARKKNIYPGEFLKKNNSHEFFKKLDDLLLTGSTDTNVMDVQIIIKS